MSHKLILLRYTVDVLFYASRALVIKISPGDSDLTLLSKPLSIADEIKQQVHLHRDDIGSCSWYSVSS